MRWGTAHESKRKITNEATWELRLLSSKTQYGRTSGRTHRTDAELTTAELKELQLSLGGGTFLFWLIRRKGTA
jgi:hypothetical protein